jgi:hypothetical protein
MLIGCDQRTLVVESNTSWEGSVDDFGPISGQGNSSIDVGRASRGFCWTIGKRTDAGTLRVFLDDKSTFGVTEFRGEQTTNEPFGEVRGCQ